MPGIDGPPGQQGIKGPKGVVGYTGLFFFPCFFSLLLLLHAYIFAINVCLRFFGIKVVTLTGKCYIWPLFKNAYTGFYIGNDPYAYVKI